MVYQHMIGLGTLINSAAIVAGGMLGHVTGRLFKPEQQESLSKTCGISVLFIAIAGAMQGMLSIDGSALVSGKSMMIVLCLAIGTVVGELIGIEKDFERFGAWLKEKTCNGGEISSGFHHHSNYDFLHGKGVCILCYPGFPV